MTSLALAAMMQVSLLATGATGTANYAEAYKSTQESGKPLVVLIGADWCPGCRTMKGSVMPQLAAKGSLKNVAYAQVNTDAEGELAGDLMQGNLIPQLVMYVKTADGWQLKRLVGAQSASAVEQFIGSAATPKVSEVGQR